MVAEMTFPQLERTINPTHDIKLFAGRSNTKLAQEIADYLGTSIGPMVVKNFADGEIYVQVKESVRGDDVFIIQPLCNPVNENLVELLIIIDAFKRASANSITAIIPYFGYAKADKKDEPRVSIRARVCADCIEMCGADRVVTMDLHAAQVQGFFSKPVDHLYASALLCEYARHLGIVNENLVVVSPDAGSAKRARAYANILGCNVAIGEKVRIGHDENPNALEIIGDVKGKTCMVVDDFTISGNTLCKVAYGLMDKGAKEIYAFLSHAIVKEDAVKLIEESPIKMLVTTDTVDNTDVLKNSKKIKVVSAAPLFAEAVRTIHEREPMAYMFEHLPARLMEMSFEDTDK